METDNKKEIISYKITTTICVGILFVFLLLIFLRIVMKNIVYEKLGVYNSFVALFLEGDNDVNNNSNDRPITIDWASIYPYAPEDSIEATKDGLLGKKTEEGANPKVSLITKYSRKIESVKDQIEWYTTDGLVAQTKFTEAAVAYENLIGWKVQEQDYDGVIFLKNDHLTCVCPDYSGDVIDEITESISRFRDFLSDRDINLCYVMVPFKVDYEGEELPIGIKDYSVSNADELLTKIGERGIDYIDLRAYETAENIYHYDMFYLTDHHWNAKSAVWGCDRVSEWLSNHYGYKYDSSIFDLNNYEERIYDDVFLGSYGRRVTLSKAKPEDFSILYPTNDMTYHLVMPEKNVDITDNFENVFIDKDFLKITDYYEMDAYSAYVTHRKYMEIITNENAVNPDKKILILRDSFGNIFAPYFAQMYGTVELLDVADFTGSIKSYINESKPDTVLLLYNPTMIEKINWKSYTGSKFDFR